MRATCLAVVFLCTNPINLCIHEQREMSKALNKYQLATKDDAEFKTCTVSSGPCTIARQQRMVYRSDGGGSYGHKTITIDSQQNKPFRESSYRDFVVSKSQVPVLHIWKISCRS